MFICQRCHKKVDPIKGCNNCIKPKLKWRNIWRRRELTSKN